MYISWYIHNLVSLLTSCATKVFLPNCSLFYHCQDKSSHSSSNSSAFGMTDCSEWLLYKIPENPPMLCLFLSYFTLYTPVPKLATTRVIWASSSFFVTLLKARHIYSSAWANLWNRTSSRGPSVMTWVELLLLEIQT